MSLLILPEEIMTNIIENVSDYNLYIYRIINRRMNGILNREINIRSKTYGGELGIKYNIIYDMTKNNRENILKNIRAIPTGTDTYMEHWTRTQFRIFGLELLRNNIGVSIWLNI